MKYTWLVEKYLEGELSGEALRKFELEILRKPEVADEVERVRSMNQFMQEQHQKLQDSIGLIEDYEDMDHVLDEEEIRHNLDGLKVRKISAAQKDVTDLNTKLTEVRVSHTLSNQHSKKILVRKISVWMAAASVAILLVTSSLLLIGNHGPVDYMALYKAYHTAPYADGSERSPDADHTSPLDQALHLYNQQEYKEAFQVFNSIPEASVHNPSYFKFRGLTAMELGDFQAAIKSFDNLETDPVLNQEAMWYKGLCYLAMEDLPSARSFCRKIIAENGHFKNQAKSLLKKI